MSLFRNIVAVVLFCSSACTIEAIQPFEPPNGAEIGQELGLAEQKQFLSLVNEIRAKGCTCGKTRMPPVPPLALQDQLTEAANHHVIDMVENDFFAHKAPDGSTVGTRISRTGYAWSAVGENIAWGYSSVDDVLQGWLISKGHCKNLMNGSFRHLGIAKKNAIWVNTLARPRKDD